MAPGIARLVLPALAAASLAAGACAGHTCPNGAGGVFVALPAAESSPIVEAVTDSPCTASAGPEEVLISRPTAGGCQVIVHLANGGIYQISVSFSVRQGQCPGLVAGVPVTQPIDGGPADADADAGAAG